MDFTDFIGEQVLVGDKVWAEIQWSVKSAQQDINFYVKNCEMTISEEAEEKITASFVRDNCYSEALGVKKIGAEWIVSDSSRFLFQALSSSATTALEG